jgi:hypothetical protein
MSPIGLTFCIAAVIIAVVLLLRYGLRGPERSISKFLRLVESGKQPDSPAPPDYDHELVPTGDGFEIRALKQQSPEKVRIVWDKVIEANAYKVDLWSTDLICVGFTMEDQTCIEIHEEMRGFCDLCVRLPTALPEALAFGSWYLDITVPAFQPCLTRLFTRTPSAPSPGQSHTQPA